MAPGVWVKHHTDAALSLCSLVFSCLSGYSTSDSLRSSVARHSIGHSASEKVKQTGHFSFSNSRLWDKSHSWRHTCTPFSHCRVSERYDGSCGSLDFNEKHVIHTSPSVLQMSFFFNISLCCTFKTIGMICVEACMIVQEQLSFSPYLLCGLYSVIDEMFWEMVMEKNKGSQKGLWNQT